MTTSAPATTPPRSGAGGSGPRRVLAAGSRRVLAGAAAAGLTLSLACAGGEVRLAGEEGTPHQTYTARLEEAGLHRTALGRAWIEAADRALADPTDVELPHREVRWLDPREASAVAFRIPLENGQRLVIDAQVSGANPAGITLFLDLFHEGAGAGSPERVASADSARWRLEHVADRSGSYLLRVQPELLRGGRLTVTLAAEASLAFPVPGIDLAASRSGFGDARAGGRDHEGVDLLAPRGTPVVAAAAGRVTRADAEREGGNVVWLREEAHGRRLYYAHLERHAVERGTRVAVGDTLGYVGTTGNARTTRPHLHFGVYVRRRPVDPTPHLRQPPGQVEPFTADPGLLGSWARTSVGGAALHRLPDPGTKPVARLAARTPVEVTGGSGGWYAARLPDGRSGYVRAGEVERLTPLRTVDLSGPSPLRAGAGPAAALMDSLAAGRTVSLLGAFGDHVLARVPPGDGPGHRGWLPTASVDG